MIGPEPSLSTVSSTLAWQRVREAVTAGPWGALPQAPTTYKAPNLVNYVRSGNHATLQKAFYREEQGFSSYAECCYYAHQLACRYTRVIFAGWLASVMLNSGGKYTARAWLFRCTHLRRHDFKCFRFLQIFQLGESSHRLDSACRLVDAALGTNTHKAAPILRSALNKLRGVSSQSFLSRDFSHAKTNKRYMLLETSSNGCLAGIQLQDRWSFSQPCRIQCFVFSRSIVHAKTS